MDARRCPHNTKTSRPRPIIPAHTTPSFLVECTTYARSSWRSDHRLWTTPIPYPARGLHFRYAGRVVTTADDQDEPDPRLLYRLSVDLVAINAKEEALLVLTGYSPPVFTFAFHAYGQEEQQKRPRLWPLQNISGFYPPSDQDNQPDLRLNLNRLRMPQISISFTVHD